MHMKKDKLQLTSHAHYQTYLEERGMPISKISMVLL